MGIHIELDNPNRFYFSGEVVSGRVIIQNAKEDKVKEVTILLDGDGRVHWTEHLPRVRPLRYSNKETYIAYKSTLAGGGHGENLITLPEGTIAYPFRFELPKSLPSSFNSINCQVSYVLTAVIKRAGFFKFGDKFRLPFTVNGILDLNLESGASMPQECSRTQGYNFCGYNKGQISFVLKLLHRSGFVAGEVINFRAEITNNSSRKIYRAVASLQQTNELYSQRVSTTIIKTITEVKGPSVGKGEYEVWEGSLEIPPVPPTKLGGNSQIHDVQYILDFEMAVSGFRDIKSMSGYIPIIIGNIPLRSTFGDFVPGPRHTLAIKLKEPMPSTSTNPGYPEGSLEGVDPPPLFPDYPDLPPPSYAEATGVDPFTWHPEGNAAEDQQEVGQKNVVLVKDDMVDAPNHTPKTSSPSVDDFVPKYVTYNRKNVGN